jgi:hypothetical protein
MNEFANEIRAKKRFGGRKGLKLNTVGGDTKTLEGPVDSYRNNQHEAIFYQESSGGTMLLPMNMMSPKE